MIRFTVLSCILTACATSALSRAIPDDDADSSDAGWDVAPGLLPDGASPGPISTGPPHYCVGFAWAPDATGVPCQYAIPMGFDPRRDYPASTVVDVDLPGAQPGQYIERAGRYQNGATYCELLDGGQLDGWYYDIFPLTSDGGLLSPDAGTPHIMLCPSLCEAATEDGAFVRINVTLHCD